MDQEDMELVQLSMDRFRRENSLPKEYPVTRKFIMKRVLKFYNDLT